MSDARDGGRDLAADVVSSADAEGLAVPIMEARALERVYGRDGIATTALSGVSLRVRAGEFLDIMGPSGSGKSTLLRCLGGLDVPTSGSAYLQGQPLGGRPASELARLRREVVSFVPQDADLIETLDVLHNIMLPLAIAGRRGEGLERLAREQARRLGIEPILRRRPYQLSRGQRQLVSVARALSQGPKVLLADEPTSALDSSTAGMVLANLRDFNRSSGASVVMVTHDASAASWGDRVVFLLDGRIFAEVRRGTDSRKRFFSRIIGMMGMMGAGGDR